MKRQAEVEAQVAALWQLSGVCDRLWKLQAVLSSQAHVQSCFLCLARLLSSAFSKTKGSRVVRERLLRYVLGAAVRSSRVLAAQRAEVLNYAAA